MGFHLQLPKFLKHPNNKDGISTPSTPNSKNPSPNNSRTPSLIDEPLSSGQTTPNNEKYLHDPMRHNDHPDYVGSFVDPMGGHQHSYESVDPTNTGA